MSTILTKEQESFNQLVEGIEQHLKKNDNYHFRPIQIDGINVYILLYGKSKILNVESIYINCKVDIDESITTQKYSLYHYKYKSIKHAVERVKKIKSEYRIYDGEIVSAKYYKLMKLEEVVLHYSDDECCVVCYDNTSDLTECNHPICLGCREKCILQNQKDCPVCRSNGALCFYKNRSGMINNKEYEYLKIAIHKADEEEEEEIYDALLNHQDDSDDDSDSDYSDDSGSDAGSDAGEMHISELDISVIQQDGSHHDLDLGELQMSDLDISIIQHDSIQSDLDPEIEMTELLGNIFTEDTREIFQNHSLFSIDFENDYIPWRISRSPSHNYELFSYEQFIHN
jgi:hypothetical protein